MQLKILQLNTWALTKLPEIKAFLEKNDFDILCFQEVSGPRVRHGNIHSTIDGFAELQSILGNTHNGEMAISHYASSNPTKGYFGNALFYKKEFTLKSKNLLWLYKRDTPFPSDAVSFEEVGRNVFHATLEKDGKTFSVLCTHLPWANTKFEQPHQREQNLKLIEYLKGVGKPWILAGDFNINLGQPSILDLEKLGRNLSKEGNVTNTVDPTIHVRWEKMKPGAVIDYIFVSPDVQVDDFAVLNEIHMSDHFGLTAELSF